MVDKQEAYIQYNQDDKQVNVRYKFEVIDSEELNMESQVTEYVVEDGSMRQEHTTVSPVEFILEGYVAEKVYWSEPQVVGGFLAQYTSKLQPIAALLPEVSSYAQTVVATANYVERNIKQVVNKVKNLSKRTISENTNTKIQRQVADEFRVLRENRTLVTVTSDFGTFNDMYIESVRMTQEDTYDQCRLIVKLKQYQSVETQLVAIDTKKYMGRIQQQAAQEQDLGNIQGKTMSTLRSWVSPNIVPYFTGVQ